MAQMEQDSEAARQLQRDMEEEDAANLAEQERVARQLQEQLEGEERAAMAEIRAAQQQEAANKTLPQAPVAEAACAAQRRLSLDADTWSLVLQVCLAWPV